MFSRTIVVSPDLVIRIRAYPSRRLRALRALRAHVPQDRRPVSRAGVPPLNAWMRAVAFLRTWVAERSSHASARRASQGSSAQVSSRGLPRDLGIAIAIDIFPQCFG
jgi:hypothetical protein